MMVMASTSSIGSTDEWDDKHATYRKYGQVIFNGTNGSTSRAFGLEIARRITEMTQAWDGYRVTEHIYPVLHEFFMSLINEEAPKANEEFKSTITIFTACSQIDMHGKWKNVRYVKSVPARLKYCFRSIVLYDILLKSNQLNFADQRQAVPTSVEDGEEDDGEDEDEGSFEEDDMAFLEDD
ncbi:uncharacterized protein ATC70_001746 [Mucor velutinosus]|uniref:Uncharacterized protein n=1 Tax=Mucor velutinosus TaxID=708070 RepID=A0AAN7HM14_9FUNG|nr:hypothetical protein ATC70_001746 [Mucor velutinosus]